MIETERLVLRPPASDDLPWLREEMNSEAVMRHLGGARNDAEVADGLAADIAAFAEPKGWRRWTIWRRDDERRIGRCGLFHVRSGAAPDGLRGSNEIGWTLAERFWGQGYATEAARAVLSYGFGAARFPIIFAQTSDSNVGSTRMMVRLGFDRLPALDYTDPDYPPEDNPTTVWRMTRDVWRARA
ncbi:GNAT family N-acetyltransferase [Sphingopyxis indica]|uniref:Protein N-acetyltransferase, RimJ/RimL family n=1 Tax=Sphingopyxis indica TaxID=436663 RepID=A0A239GM25_9SPHN|nr:GNAT family N-acetyltransferase [Sphingopyxis indica]WOF44000.1 GNAT family N-acetyltransferase [Sphingopyxis indica]SNS69104.1 Protein N-acetyltransferase, RimJ/RimL family [Sphingopyxis indica]